MTPSQSLFVHWYFHIPNLLMIALTYALIGRFIVSLFLAEDRVIVRVFTGITNPVLQTVGFITPRIVPAGLLIVFAMGWLFVARILLFFVLALMGIRPVLG